MEVLGNYFKRWKLMINYSKCQSIYFTRCRAIRKLPQSNIIINGNSINWDPSAKYLGIHLDQKLTFNTHIAKIVEKCNKLFLVLYPLLNRNSGLNFENKLLIYKAIVKPIIMYGSPIWWQSASTHIKKITSFTK